MIELVVTVVVAAVLMAIALPSFLGTIRSNRVSTTTNEVVASLALARGEAIRNTRGAGICPSSSGNACDGDWTDGWVIWSDTNGNEELNADEVIRFVQVGARVVVRGPDTPIEFDARGRLTSGATTLEVEPEDCDERQEKRILTVGLTGHVSRPQSLAACE